MGEIPAKHQSSPTTPSLPFPSWCSALDIVLRNSNAATWIDRACVRASTANMPVVPQAYAWTDRTLWSPLNDHPHRLPTNDMFSSLQSGPALGSLVRTDKVPIRSGTGR